MFTTENMRLEQLIIEPGRYYSKIPLNALVVMISRGLLALSGMAVVQRVSEQVKAHVSKSAPT